MHQVENLAKVLKTFKKSYLVDYCGHYWDPSWDLFTQNQLMPNHKQSIEHQRRLNPPMKEVVKKEIIKWFDVGVIYPITDSSWVCHVQFVPKKGGMNVVPNEKNELVPMRTVTGWRVCMDYCNLMHGPKKTIFLCPSWIRCWIDLP